MADTVEVISGNGEDRGGGGGKLPSEVAEEFDREERREREEKKKQRDPPIVFRNAVDVSTEKTPNLSQKAFCMYEKKLIIASENKL